MSRRASFDLISIMKAMEDIEELEADSDIGGNNRSDDDDDEGSASTTGGEEEGRRRRAALEGEDDDDEDEAYGSHDAIESTIVFVGDDDEDEDGVGEDELADDELDDGGEGEGGEAYDDEFTPSLMVVEETSEVGGEQPDGEIFLEEPAAAGMGSQQLLSPLYEEGTEAEASNHQEDPDNSNSSLPRRRQQQYQQQRGEENLMAYGDYYDCTEEPARTSASSRMLDSAASGMSSDTATAAAINSNSNIQPRLSFASSDASIKSAPAMGGRQPESPDRRTQQRRITINIPQQSIAELGGPDGTDQSPAAGAGAGGSPRRRQSRHRSIRASAVSSMTDDSYGSSRNTILQSIRRGTPFNFSSSMSTSTSSSSTTTLPYIRRSLLSSRRAGSASGVDSGGGSNALGMAAAVDRLGSHEQNTDWENAAAAAAVVAATTQTAPARNFHQFGTDENVLVLLNLLNITNRQDDKAHFTIDPVNKHGFPPGEGKTDEQRHGPFSFVLCQVCKVHFDEDERYYTVRRADTGSEQRADPGWMEPIEGTKAIEAAMAAARRTQYAEAESPGQHAEQAGPCNCLVETMAWPVHCAMNNMIPFYRSSRRATKVLLENLLRGSKGFACRFKLSFINFLVLCSFIYLLIEPFTVAFLPASLDYSAAIVELVVWCILLLELIFEFIIRPAGYHKLIKSDRAYAPSTARHINRFHLVCELIALLLFIPQFPCVAKRDCGDGDAGSLRLAALKAVLGTTTGEAALGRFRIGLAFFRLFGLVRHWKNMWINDTFHGKSGPENSFLRQILLLGMDTKPPWQMFSRNIKSKSDAELNDNESTDFANSAGCEEDKKLQMNATIGTALMVVNSHRALLLLLFITAVFPVIYTLGRSNTTGTSLVELLQANNLAANTTSDCDYLENAVQSWLRGSAGEYTTFDLYGNNMEKVFVLWAQVLPVRCAFQTEYPFQAGDGVITHCRQSLLDDFLACRFWDAYSPAPEDATPDYFADVMGTRTAGILDLNLSLALPADFDGSLSNETLSVRVLLNENTTLSFTMTSLFILLLVMLILVLVGLTVMRNDAQRLVLDPLQRMLRIVIRYAENPLAPTPTVSRKSVSKTGSDSQGSKSTFGGSKEQLGNYETEQLITAISKIADLLRKCWGVAGAGIISSNLARTKDGKTVVFNPTVPGKRVYALFGFIAINDFGMLLKALDNDVMVLINDVARVVHDEVYRWALGDSGQCNKNLGSAFLMVFRIGDFNDVHDKNKRAADVVFNSQMTRNARLRRRSVLKKSSGKRGRVVKNENLRLASLPGIQTFSDRALLGLLKSFAGIHRDQRMNEWEKDLRLGAGVGAFTTSVIYGMDAGWAVEGAVGSEHKIDATYLSPHVNMASRMMSATKQYGVTILLSQAVEELLSRQARDKLRHLDTVFVKGSSVAQRIFTYDARYDGADFFLFDRSPEQADRDAENYTHMIWNTDQDLKAMRQHVTDEFMERFKEGLDQYLEGEWPAAVESLQKADELMIEAVMEEGYVDYDLRGLEQEVFNRKTSNEEVIRIRNDFGDGACKCLIQYMQRRKCKPPEDWQGVRHLMSK